MSHLKSSTDDAKVLFTFENGLQSRLGSGIAVHGVPIGDDDDGILSTKNIPA